MILAHFYKSDGRCTGFSVSGHAGYADSGADIVCASVSSAVQLTANAITEILHLPAKVEIGSDTVRLTLAREADILTAQPYLEALQLHLRLLAEDFEQTIELSE